MYLVVVEVYLVAVAVYLVAEVEVYLVAVEVYLVVEEMAEARGKVERECRYQRRENKSPSC